MLGKSQKEVKRMGFEYQTSKNASHNEQHTSGLKNTLKKPQKSHCLDE
jgi:hypothetical protein